MSRSCCDEFKQNLTRMLTSTVLLVLVFIVPSFIFPTVAAANIEYKNERWVTDGWVLDQPRIISGDLYIDSGTIDLHGNTLTVTGSLIQNGGTMDINGGTLAITGNYNIGGGGKLEMTNSLDVVRVGGNFYTNSNFDHGLLLTEGLMEIAGNFNQTNYNWGSASNFRAGQGHKVRLTGTVKQEVHFVTPDNSRFGILEIANNSGQSVYFTSQADFERLTSNGLSLHMVSARKWRLTADETVIWNENETGTLAVTGNVYLNDFNLKVEGNLSQSGGTLDIDGGTLEVRGDLNQSGGTMDINGGTLAVTGNYNIGGGGKLEMTSSLDVVRVGGNFFTNSNYDHGPLLTDGMLEIAGNFNQTNAIWGSPSNFRAGQGHKVRLTGTVRQDINFLTPDNSGFGILEIANNSGQSVYFTGQTDFDRLTSNGLPLHMVSARKWRLTADETVIWDENETRTLTVTENVYLNGHTLKVEGNLSQSGGTLDIDGGTLEVRGDLNQSGGTMDINGGTLAVTGNYNIGGGGKLEMTNSLDAVRVGGNFYTNSNYDHGPLLTDGMLEIAGNFNQTNYGWGSPSNFRAGQGHKVRLTGTVKQEVNFITPNNSGFGILEIANSSSAGVVFISRIVVTTLFDHHQNKFLVTQTSNFPDYDGDGVVDDKDPYPLSSMAGDFDSDNTISVNDMVILTRDYGTTGSGSKDLVPDNAIDLFDFIYIARRISVGRQ
ncbi:MAG: translocation/assembly module TamB domain-containing protein [Bacillota bacterium]